MAPTDPFVIPEVCVSLQADKKDNGGSGGHHITTGLMIQEIKDDNKDEEKNQWTSIDLLMTK